MQKRHLPLPRLWLMTDERLGDALLPSISALPRSSGVIFRHYGLSQAERCHLFGKVKAVCRRRRHVLLVAGSPLLARAWGADGSHGRHIGALSAPVHSIRERILAEKAGAELLFVSPVFETASHPGSKGLGHNRFGMIAGGAKKPVVALGGLSKARARSLRCFGIYGWAAIDSLLA